MGYMRNILKHPTIVPYINAISELSTIYELIDTYSHLGDFSDRGISKNTHIPIVFFPGLLCSHSYMSHLDFILTSLGYKVYDWNQGINLGPNDNLEKNLYKRITKIYNTTGFKPIIIGHSLGGIYGRVLANSHPDKIKGLITLGSPVLGDPNHPGLKSIFRNISGKDLPDIDETTINLIKNVPPIHNLCLYTEKDGVVNWQDTADTRISHENVWGSHCGLPHNRKAILRIISFLNDI